MSEGEHQENMDNTKLFSYRVLDLTGEEGCYCGSILGELGADVILIEKPDGSPARKISPFYQDVPDPQRSLFWFAYNANKRGVTLNIETVEGRQILKRLLKNIDILIESYPPGHMSKLGLDYKELKRVNNALIMASITPFGQTGPHRNYKTSDLVSLAMGGYLHTSGSPDRAPVRISAPQAYCHASVHAAAAITIALYYRELSGQGQYIDVSIQECVVRSLFTEYAFWEYAKEVVHRRGPYIRRGKTYGRNIWHCKDGEVGFYMVYGRFGRRMKPLVEWMKQEGIAGCLEAVTDWEAVDVAKLTPEEHAAWEDTFANFFIRHTKKELFDFALREGVYLAPASCPRDIFESPQLEAREYWTQVKHRELDIDAIYPGPAYKMSRASPQVICRVPLIGEHNQDIYIRELGFSKKELRRLKDAGII